MKKEEKKDDNIVPVIITDGIAWSFVEMLKDDVKNNLSWEFTDHNGVNETFYRKNLFSWAAPYPINVDDGFAGYIISNGNVSRGSLVNIIRKAYDPQTEYGDPAIIIIAGSDNIYSIHYPIDHVIQHVNVKIKPYLYILKLEDIADKHTSNVSGVVLASDVDSAILEASIHYTEHYTILECNVKEISHKFMEIYKADVK